MAAVKKASTATAEAAELVAKRPDAITGQTIAEFLNRTHVQAIIQQCFLDKDSQVRTGFLRYFITFNRTQTRRLLR